MKEIRHINVSDIFVLVISDTSSAIYFNKSKVKCSVCFKQKNVLRQLQTHYYCIQKDRD